MAGLVASCSSKPRCFECGLTKEWARAREEEEARAKRDAGADATRDPRAKEAPKVPPPPPIALPAPGTNGCVAPERAAEFSTALEKHARETLAATIAKEGGTVIEREGFYFRNDLEEPTNNRPAGEPYEVNGKRFVELGSGDTTSKPVVQLAKLAGNVLRVVHPRPRSHQLIVKVCGVNPCRYGRGARVQVLPFAIELLPGESMGRPFAPVYDTWWVFRSYTTSRDCGPPPP